MYRRLFYTVALLLVKPPRFEVNAFGRAHRRRSVQASEAMLSVAIPFETRGARVLLIRRVLDIETTQHTVAMSHSHLVAI